MAILPDWADFFQLWNSFVEGLLSTRLVRLVQSYIIHITNCFLRADLTTKHIWACCNFVNVIIYESLEQKKFHRPGRTDQRNKVQQRRNQVDYPDDLVLILPLRMMYRGFKQECPNGAVNEDTFREIYEKFFPYGSKNYNTPKFRDYVPFFIMLIFSQQSQPKTV